MQTKKNQIFNKIFETLDVIVKKKPFDFSDIKHGDDEININEFLDIAEINKAKHNRPLVFQVMKNSYKSNFHKN